MISLGGVQAWRPASGTRRNLREMGSKPDTLRKALKKLEAEEIVEIYQRRETFVRKAREEIFDNVLEISNSMQKMKCCFLC